MTHCPKTHTWSALGARLAASGALIAGGLAFATSAQALTISATYGDPYTAAQQAEIQTAISFYENTFSDNISLNIKFVNSGNGLGSTSQSFYKISYATYLLALRNDNSSANDATALANIPNGTGALPVAGQNSPVPGTGSDLLINRAGAAAVGISLGSQTDGVTSWDAVIDLNLGLLSTDHANPGANPTLYDERSVAMHEINEVLGTSSSLGGTGFFGGTASPIDLYRYDAAGNRTYTTAGDDAYFSINGTTQLARFNQDAGGDYGDFWSANGGNVYQIQDAFSTPGMAAEMNVETTMLDVIGYTFTSHNVPEPGSMALVLAGLGLAGTLTRRAKR
jgi:hypothetical protein